MTHTLAPAAGYSSFDDGFADEATSNRLAGSVNDAGDARLAALLAASGCPKTYSTAEVAQFFGKSDQWVYWVLRERATRSDGSRIEPERVGKSNRRRFTQPVIEEWGVMVGVDSRTPTRKDPAGYDHLTAKGSTVLHR